MPSESIEPEMDDIASVPREVQLDAAIQHIENKCARLEVLIATERPSKHQVLTRRIMEGEVWAMRMLIAKAKGEF